MRSTPAVCVLLLLRSVRCNPQFVNKCNCYRHIREIQTTRQFSNNLYKLCSKTEYFGNGILSMKITLKLLQNRNCTIPENIYSPPRIMVLLEKLTVSKLVNKFSAFYGTRLPCSQDPAIGPYPEPDESSHLPTHFSKIHVILPPTPSGYRGLFSRGGKRPV